MYLAFNPLHDHFDINATASNDGNVNLSYIGIARHTHVRSAAKEATVLCFSTVLHSIAPGFGRGKHEAEMIGHKQEPIGTGGCIRFGCKSCCSPEATPAL